MSQLVRVRAQASRQVTLLPTLSARMGPRMDPGTWPQVVSMLCSTWPRTRHPANQASSPRLRRPSSSSWGPEMQDDQRGEGQHLVHGRRREPDAVARDELLEVEGEHEEHLQVTQGSHDSPTWLLTLRCLSQEQDMANILEERWRLQDCRLASTNLYSLNKAWKFQLTLN